MSNGIFRKTTLGINKEGVYGTPLASAQFVMPNVELSISEKVLMADDNAMLGSTYEVDNSRPALQYCEFSMKMKVDENVLPMLLMQKFSISSALVSGETSVYAHTLTYLNNNAPASGQSFSLFFDDADRQDLVIAGARFEKIDFVFKTKDIVIAEISGKGKYPTATTVTNAVSAAPRDFVGRNVSLEMADYGSSLASFSALEATAKHTFGLSGDDDNFALGSTEMTNLFTLADLFSIELTTLMADETIKAKRAAGTKQQAKFTVQDTSRFVIGTAVSTRPEITLFYPTAYISEWARDGGANDVVKQKFTLKAVDDPAVATAPLQIVVKNNVATY